MCEKDQIMEELILLRKRVLQLEQNELLFQETEKSGKVGGWQFDPLTMKQNWTDQVFRILEIDLEDSAPEVPKGLEFIDPEFRPMAEKAIQKAMEQGVPYNQEWIVTTLKGNKKWVNAVCNPKVKEGKVVAVSGSFQDITQRKNSEEQLKALNQQLTANEQQLRAANQQLQANEQQLRAANEQLQANEQQLRAANQQLQANEQQLRAANQQLLASEKELKDTNKNLLEAKGKVEESEEKYRTLFNSMQEGVYLHRMVYDDQGSSINYRIIDANDISEKHLKIKKNDAIGKLATELFKTEEAPFIEVYSKVAETGIPYVFEQYFEPMDKHFSISVFSPKKGYFATVFTDISSRKQSEAELRKIEWLLQPKKEKKEVKIPNYGDLTLINEDRTILDSVGKEVLNGIVNDYLSLLDTSAAVYEKNGDYAVGIFSSEWCQFMDCSSRALCKSKDNKRALESGKWLCHESCWKDASSQAIQTNKVVDIECNGGLHIYALPIEANNEVVGAINFGYGNPPTDEDHLIEIANKYKVPIKKLKDLALRYETRPAFIIDIAKERLESSARLIGNIIESKQAEKEINKAREKAEESEEKHRFIFDNTIQGVVYQNSVGAIIYANKASERILGLSLDQMQGRKSIDPSWKAIHEAGSDYPGETHPAMVSLQTGQIINDAIMGVYSPVKNDYTWININSFPKFKDGEKKPYQVVTTFEDITEIRKKTHDLIKAKEKAEESEEKIRQIFENSTIVHYSHDLNHVVNYVSPQVENILGYTQDEVKVKWTSLTSDNPINEVAYKSTLRAIETGEKQPAYQLEFIHKNGKKVLVEAHEAPVVKDGKTVFIVGSFADITERKKSEIELLKAKEKAEESEAFLQLINNTTFDQIYSYDLENRFTSANKRLCENLNLNVDDIVGKTFWELGFPEENCKAWDELHRKAYLNGHIKEISPSPMPDGTTQYFEVNLFVIKDSDGTAIGLAGVNRNITESILSEQKLIAAKERAEESAADLKLAQHIANIGNWHLDPKIGVPVWSDYVYEIYERNIEDGLPHIDDYKNIYEPDQYEIFKKAITTAIKEGNNYDIILKLEFPKNRIKWVRSICQPDINRKSEAGYFLRGTIQDITNLKKAEDNLIKNQFYLKKAQEMGKIGTWELDILANKLFWTEENYKIFGIPTGTPMTYESFLNTIHPEDRNYIDEKWSEALKNNNYDIEHRLLVKGEVKWVREKAEIEFDTKGNAIKAIGFTHDITARKIIENDLLKAKEKAEENEKKFRTVFKQNNSVQLLIDPTSGKIVDVNQAACDFYGYSYEDLTSISIQDINQYSTELIMHEMLRAKEKECNYFEFIHKLSNGSLKNVEVYSNPIKIKGKEYLISIIHDITERKQVEDALLKSKDLLNETGRMAKVGGWEIDLNGNTLAWTEETFRIHELQLDGQPNVADAINYYHPDDRDMVASAFEKTIKTGSPFDFEARLITSKGNLLWVRVSGKVIYQKGEIISIRGSIQDITKQKRIEKELSEYHEELEKRVEERTSELQEKMNEIERFNKLFIGREFRIKELRDKIKELEKRLNK